jgi:hypothetical protein
VLVAYFLMRDIDGDAIGEQHYKQTAAPFQAKMWLKSVLPGGGAIRQIPFAMLES